MGTREPSQSPKEAEWTCEAGTDPLGVIIEDSQVMTEVHLGQTFPCRSRGSPCIGVRGGGGGGRV